MEIYDSEEQQVEAIKAWWKKNGRSVIAGTVVGFGVIFGWRYYTEAVVVKQEQLSAQYTQVIEGDELAPALQQFIDEHNDSQYAVMASLKLAKELVDAKKYEEAEKQLLWAASQGSELFSSLAGVRLARVQIQLEKYDDAMTTLAKIPGEAFKAAIAELKGDIYLAKGNVDAARAAYLEAVASAGAAANRNLQMKLDDLAEPDVAVSQPDTALSQSSSAAQAVVSQ